jgi:hypothetical protein
MIKETDVFRKESIIYSGRGFQETAVLSVLFFLLTGKDFANITPQEDIKTKEIRRKAVVDFIYKRLDYFAERAKSVPQDIDMDVLGLNQKAEAIIDEIAITEKAIADAIGRSRGLLREILATDTQLSECSTLLTRYHALRTQYGADIKRLSLIVDAGINRTNLPGNTECPFCRNEIPAREQHDYFRASEVELDKIRLKLADLAEAENDLVAEHSKLEAKSDALKAEKLGIDAMLNGELRPKVENLKKVLDEYRRAIEANNATTLIGEFTANLQDELGFQMVESEEDEPKFNIKSHFDGEFLRLIRDYLHKVLTASRYIHFNSAHLDLSTFDVVVNGQPKRTHGKGYRAFLNTVFAIVLMELLAEHGTYAPGLLIIDSPILTLKESGDEAAPDSMKSALFQYLLDNQGDGQVIIMENSIPDLDYSGIKVNIFTQDEKSGRYGLLKGVHI